MDLSFPPLARTLRSASQIARLRSEEWAQANLYCVACPCNQLSATPPNTPAIDFRCGRCGESYELKSGKRLPSRNIADAAYAPMIAAIREGRAPNLLYVHYDPQFGVEDLILIPRFFLVEHCIEPRRPLGPTARRAGWVGCSIRLDLLPPSGRINLVTRRTVASPASVREQYELTARLRHVPPTLRGWPLAVLREVHRLEKREFRLAEVYAAEAALRPLFPSNRHIRPKIRQQLQVLRDAGLLDFLGSGRYRLRTPAGGGPAATTGTE